MSNALILASGSSARAALLRGAGVDFIINPAHLDEDQIKLDMAARGAGPETVAQCLAEEKARIVSNRYVGRLVLGADQMLALGEVLFDKPANLDVARENLRSLRGKTHRLISAAALVRDGVVIWRGLTEARLTMRDFSDGFLDSYLADSGPEILESVGVYRLEGRGVQLFESVDGDYFTILGLPLLPLLDFLRRDGMLLS